LCLGVYTLNIFLVVLCKILMAKGLRDRGIVEFRQNIESKGLAGKIFWNKELVVEFDSLTRRLAEDGLGELSRIPQLALLEILSKGCSSQFWEIFLWKAVGKAERKSIAPASMSCSQQLASPLPGADGLFQLL